MGAAAGGVGLDAVDLGIGLDLHGELEGVVFARVSRGRTVLRVSGAVAVHVCVRMRVRRR